MKHNFNYIFLIYIFFTVGCEEPLNWQPVENSKNLVVDGLILNHKGSYIRLSNSTSYNSVLDAGNVTPLIGATVIIEDSNGNIHNFYEQLIPGTYVDTENTDPFYGVIGLSYKLHIKTTQGKEYTSKTERLNETAYFDSLFYLPQKKEKINAHNNVIVERGIQIYSNFQFGSSSQYIRWGWSYVKTTPGIPPQIVQDFGYTNVTTRAVFNSDAIHKFQILFFKEQENATNYNLTVRQYNINKEAYDFWRKVKGQEINTGTIFDPLPSQINGNIYNINDPDEIIFGFFSAASVVEREIEFNL